MVKEFSFCNYKSFSEETIFSMEADLENVSEFPEHIVSYESAGLLKVASLYGPNGSGKSNVLKALRYFKRLVSFGIIRQDTEDERELRFLEDSGREITNFENFRFCPTNNREIVFKIFFVFDSYEVGYEVHVGRNKGIFIKYENMSYRKLNSGDDFSNMYERQQNNITLGEQFLQYDFVREAKISDQITFANFARTMYVNEATSNELFFKLITLFSDEVNNIAYFSSFRDRAMQSASRLAYPYTAKELTGKVLSVLKRLDIDISDIKVEKVNHEVTLLKAYTTRSVEGNSYNLEINEESDGTKTLLYLLPSIIRKLETGGVLIIDEIDAHLHPKLTNAIIQIFTNALNTKTQLLFTSHDILNMTNETFRRDEIWFVVKDKHFSSHLFALTDFVNYKGEKVRKDAKFSKQYLEGKFGADPFIDKGVYWNV